MLQSDKLPDRFRRILDDFISLYNAQDRLSVVQANEHVAVYGREAMPNTTRTLTHQQAQRFYDRIGAKLDKQSFYELAATRMLIAHAAFENAHSVFEFGCGTGAFAASFLAHNLPQDASYDAVDSSLPWLPLLARG